MKRIIKSILSVGLLFVLAFGIAACDFEANSQQSGGSTTDEELGVYFEETSVTLTLDETHQLIAKNAMNALTWSTNDDSVVKVDGNGVLTPVSEGVTIVKANDGVSVALCRVEVVTVRVESVLNIVVNKASLSLREGDTYTLIAFVKAADETLDCALSWESNDNSVATVENGVVVAVGGGTTEIIVKTTWNGKTVEEKIEVEVSAAAPVLFFELDNQILCGESVALNVKLMERSTEIAIDESKVVYACEDTQSVTFSDRTIVGVQKGYAVLSATYTHAGVTYMAKKEVRVREAYTVYYEVDGAVVHTQSVLDGDSFAPSATEPNKTGFIFRFWQLEGMEYDFGTSLEGDIVLQARWLAPQMYDGDDYELSVFGAYVKNTNGYTDTAVKSGNNIAYKSSGADVAHTVYLPRIKYSEYAKVEFSFSGSGWAGIGYNGQNISHEDMDGTITITNNRNNSYSLVMKQNVTVGGIASTNTYTGTFTLGNDAAIINGESGVPLLWHVYSGGRSVTFSMPTFYKEFSKLTETGSYLDEVYGSNLENLTSGGVDSPSVNTDGSVITYQPAVSGTFILTLPCVDYSQYAKVQFAYTVRDWTWFGFSDTAKGLIRDYDDKGGSGTVTVVNNNGTYKVTMTLPDGNELFMDLTDQAVINGGKGLPLFMFTEAAYRFVRIELPTFTAKEG